MSARWLLLAHQLPTSRSNARVKTWRRLQQLGAVPTRNSVYVLPNTEQCREDFEWLRSEIVALGGEATVFAADTIGGDGEQSIVDSFRRARDADYRGLGRDAQRLLATARRKPGKTSSGQAQLKRPLQLLQQRLSTLEAIDFFQAPEGPKAVSAVRAIVELVNDGNGRAATAPDVRSNADFQRRRWVTRPRPGVDRMASAWLIRQFIDPAAKFGFVERPAESDVPFDMYVGEFSHHGPLCTFETLAKRFGIRGAAVDRIGQIVHDLDMKDERFTPPEAPTVGRMVEGLRRMHVDDETLLQHGISLFEALARSFQTTDRPVGGPPNKRVQKRRRKR